MFRASTWRDAGLGDPPRWQQLNVTESVRGALRGMHGESMTKLVTMAGGSALGAYVDARPGSPTFGAVHTLTLEPGLLVVVPAGVCNGFQTTSDISLYVYCFDDEWRPDMPGRAVSALDPALGIPWPIDPPILSDKDRSLPRLADL